MKVLGTCLRLYIKKVELWDIMSIFYSRLIGNLLHWSNPEFIYIRIKLRIMETGGWHLHDCECFKKNFPYGVNLKNLPVKDFMLVGNNKVSNGYAQNGIKDGQKQSAINQTFSHRGERKCYLLQQIRLICLLGFLWESK